MNSVLKVFKNHGASAGASLTHSHSQIMALPFVPPAVAARLHSMKDYFNRTGKCSLCEFNSNDLLIAEEEGVLRSSSMKGSEVRTKHQGDGQSLYA
ncbi:hypothetical protein ACLB2K_022667 [Fragaria x ananassa]